MHSHRRRTLRVHVDKRGEPITDSIICCCCEDHAGHRIESYRRAQRHGDFPEASRVPLASGQCHFCWRQVKARP
jgi:hypothetical protein